jgi:hypothetical protein
MKLPPPYSARQRELDAKHLRGMAEFFMTQGRMKAATKVIAIANRLWPQPKPKNVEAPQR